nr:uncharacterized protein LOC122273192 [Parasteatoda tepidariorum]
MAQGLFNLRDWQTNASDLINNSDKKDVSVLGLNWNTEIDTLSCKIEPVDYSEQLITKRFVLAMAHRVFDIIGYTAPVTLLPKIILQETWNLKLSWNDEIPDNLAKRFKLWLSQLHLLEDIKIPRWLEYEPSNVVLSVNELCKAEISLMLLIQKGGFKDVNDNKLKHLRPFVDQNGVIRAKTNLDYRDDTSDFIHPIILPNNHPVVKLLILSYHVDYLHAGISLLMSHLRKKYWVLKSRKTIRNCIKHCVKCKRFKVKRCEVMPGILPSDRVNDAAVFEIIGVDLAGPLYLKDKRKAYIVLYTCAVYRAVHLELVTLMTTEAYFQSLRRFIARRGRPSVIYSDNGTNFVGAEKALRLIDWDKLSSKVAEQKIRFKFNPPSASWWGGWWERLIQMVKQILRKILGRATLNYEELLTLLCDCERIINTRPLTYVSEDVADISPLTPEMFLHEIPSSGVVDIDQVDKKNLSKQAKYLQKIRELLRARFRTEYLGQLRQQSLRDYKDKSLKVGEIVLVEDINKRTFWNLAKILKVIPGRDGHTRVALVKTENSEILRPVQRLFRLELENEYVDVKGKSLKISSSGRIVKPTVP